ncbi:ribonuclease HII [Candidatus Poribacteria bacterium]|nr:ribonuclease HII [Candidatus Poribacteria bacterium]
MLSDSAKDSQKFQQMLAYEQELYEQGYNSIAGTDEAGRGPLAGPVVAAAVILDLNQIIDGIDDSKKLSPTCRESLFKKIRQKSIAYGVGIISNDIIDKINILQASMEAMKQAVINLPVKPDFLLIDGNYFPNINLPMKAIKSGDSLSMSIAAASIIAKVTRDRIMQDFDSKHPQYGFAKNKGYPTKEHIQKLEKYGPCKIHRKSFAPVAERLFPFMYS